jgi:AcrR family transcriptional regulator
MPGVAEAEAPATKGERTRHALLDGAIKRFAADGFRATSLADIARAANVTPAAAYAYFANKEALFTEAVDTDAARLIEGAVMPLLTAGFHDDWSKLLRALTDGLDRHPLARRLLAGLEPDFTERMLDIPALAQLRNGLAMVLAAGQQVGEIRSDIDPVTTAMGLEMTVLALLIAGLQTGISPDSPQMAGVMAVLEAAVRAPKAVGAAGAGARARTRGHHGG